MFDDDFCVAAAEPVELRKRLVGGTHVIERTDAHPIERVTVSVDWRNDQIARGSKPVLQPLGIVTDREGADLHVEVRGGENRDRGDNRRGRFGLTVQFRIEFFRRRRRHVGRIGL